jgi:hypothetical protein
MMFYNKPSNKYNDLFLYHLKVEDMREGEYYNTLKKAA